MQLGRVAVLGAWGRAGFLFVNPVAFKRACS